MQVYMQKNRVQPMQGEKQKKTHRKNNQEDILNGDRKRNLPCGEQERF